MQARSVQFPNTVIDNFFQDPDAVTSFGKALDFTQTGSYPGLRTKNLRICKEQQILLLIIIS